MVANGCQVDADGCRWSQMVANVLLAMVVEFLQLDAEGCRGFRMVAVGC